ncbi:MAG: TonB-dependent receptor domain-containing protein [Oceanipulchritudo sp.]
MKTARLRLHRCLFILPFLFLGQAGLPETGGSVEADPGETGSLEVQVLDEATGEPLAGATVGFDFDVQGLTGGDGRLVLDPVPAGVYRVSIFLKNHHPATITEVLVSPGERQSLVIPLKAREVEEGLSSDIFEMEEFVITATALKNSDFTLRQMRLQANFALDTLSFADLAKFAASDVADAIKRIPGVNVQEGKFAVIRGLDDRYTSTLLNNLAIPSPDPDRQSPQLDLFPSEVVGSLVVAKSFAPELPGNSAGGSINIVTSAAPESLVLKVGAGTGFNENARDLFYIPRRGSGIGSLSGKNQRELEIGATVGTPFRLLGRNAYFQLDAGKEIDFETAIGTELTIKPLASRTVVDRSTFPPKRLLLYGDLATGIPTNDRGLFDRTVSTREERASGFLSMGVDLDEDGRHRLGGVFFGTENSDEILALKENGRFVGIDYETVTREEYPLLVAEVSGDGSGYIPSLVLNPNLDPWQQGNPETQYFTSSSFFRDREFKVGQLFGEHRWEGRGEFKADWGLAYSKTRQEEEAQRFTYYYQPPGSLPDFPEFEDLYHIPNPQAFPGIFFYSRNSIDENMLSGRVDLSYKRELSAEREMELKGSLFYEDAERSIVSSFADRFIRQGGIFTGDDPFALEQSVLNDSSGFFPIEAFTDTTREIMAVGLGGKWPIGRRLDLLAGARLENIRMETFNQLTGELDFAGVPATFPSKFFMFEVVDSIEDGFGNLGTLFESYETANPGLLNIDVPRDENGIVNLTAEQYQELLNGVVDESLFLPSVGLVYRPVDRMRVILNHSETVARPSFRELGYYVSAVPGSEDLVVGNPQLKTSDVSSTDFRIEYTYGDSLDLFALSLFSKDIRNPIEKITLFDRQLQRSFQTFFNNRNPADLEGLEFEIKKNLGFLGLRFLEFFTLGGNFTLIDATVNRPQAELDRAQYYFVQPNPPPGVTLVGEPRRLTMPESRPLFNQPEWIVNGDLTFEHPGWGTSVTLSAFSISEVLDSAGSSSVFPNGQVFDFTPDRYIGSYTQVDLVLQQKLGAWSVKFSVKNLTDSERSTFYDPVLMDPKVFEKKYRIGRDYSLSVSVSF